MHETCVPCLLQPYTVRIVLPSWPTPNAPVGRPAPPAVLRAGPAAAGGAAGDAPGSPPAPGSATFAGAPAFAGAPDFAGAPAFAGAPDLEFAGVELAFRVAKTPEIIPVTEEVTEGFALVPADLVAVVVVVLPAGAGFAAVGRAAAATGA